MTDREIVAEFMGIEKCIHGWYDRDMLLQQEVYNASNGSIHEELMFDESWDWLMPVIAKISKIDDVWIQIIPSEISQKTAWITIEHSVSYTEKHYVSEHNNSLIVAIYKAVVKFIKRYNENKE